jgi:hypothetical protein
VNLKISLYAVLAQLVERIAFNHVVMGLIPTDGVSLVNFFVFHLLIFFIKFATIKTLSALEISTVHNKTFMRSYHVSSNDRSVQISNSILCSKTISTIVDIGSDGPDLLQHLGT